MEETKSKVVKSKSSNSTQTKYNQMDKKSRSNATFQTNAAKKRGVYVESKSTKESLNNSAGNTSPKEPIKAPKRPCRGQKRFLASVLSLLSKSSTGTQYPDPVQKKPRMKRTNKIENKVDVTIEIDKRKKKYKSKILNSSNYPPDTFEVLQHKRNIMQTPSVDLIDDEEADDIKWSEFLPRLVQPDSEEIKMEKDTKLSHLIKEVAEGRMINEKHVTIQADEPPTLVSENKKNTTKDPEFYNFFVDLMETTFSVYNMKSEVYQGVNQSANSSKVAFEIDEAVADKLNVSEIPRPPSHSRYKQEPKKEELVDYFQLCAPRRNPPLKKKKNKSEYYPKYRTPKSNLRQPVIPQSISMKSSPLFPQTGSMTQKKSFNKKQTLLNMLKEQLRMDNQPLEEPQNLFQALKVMAINKQKSQKTLRFQKTQNELAECIFKTRRLVPRRSKLKSDSHKIMPSPRPSDYNKRQKKYLNSEDEDSNHSLEVVNIDYDKYSKTKRRKGVVASNNSPLSYSASFSPVESALDTSYERSYAPRAQQIMLSVKSVRHCRSKDFCVERDEALT